MPGISEIIENTLTIEKNYLEKNWEMLSSIKEERIVLTELASGNNSLYSVIESKSVNIARALKNLAGKGVIVKKDRKIRFTDPLFEYWLKKNVVF